MSALTLQLPPVLKLTDEQFAQLATANQDLRLELTVNGELIIMPPTGGETGNRNFEIYIDLGIWNRQTQLGKALLITHYSLLITHYSLLITHYSLLITPNRHQKTYSANPS